MNLVNIKKLKKYIFPAHGGKGKIHMNFSFEDMRGVGMWHFFAYAELPIGSDTGYHKHTGNDEWYFIIDGEASVIVDGEKKRIKKGDCVLTLSGSSHAIVDVKKKLKFIAVEVSRGKKPKPYVE